jgi:penicillin-binding protein 2
MINRRKRIPLEPEGIHAKRPDTSRRSAERHWLNRRMFLVKGAVATGFAALGARLAQLQLLEKTDYQEQADDYTQDIVKTRAPRGMIFDRAGRTVAENKRTWAVQVTPALLPDATEDPEGLKRVKDTLVSALELNQVLIVDPEAVPIGTEDTVYARIVMLLGYAEEEQQEQIDRYKFLATINYVVLCDDNLSADLAASFRAAAKELPGVSVVSYLDYLLLNTWSGLETPITVAKGVAKDVAMKLEANKVLLPGVSIDDSALARTYPSGPLMAHILGYVSLVTEDDVKNDANKNEVGKPIYDAEDFIGVAGLEYTQEKLLRGTKGYKTVEVDANGVIQRNISVEQEPVPGKDLHLTIDLEIQSVLRQAITDIAQYSAEDRKIRNVAQDREPVTYKTGPGAVVMIDVRNGEILGMVSMPDFDNQLFIEGLSVRKNNELNSEAAYRPLVNRAVAEHYPPGSTLKPYIAVSALREKVITETDTFYCGGGMRVPYTYNELDGNNYKCWNTEPGHEEVDVRLALMQSCDIFFYNAGTSGSQAEDATEPLHYYDLNWATKEQGDKHYFRGMGIAKIHENLTKRFWFGDYTGIELPTEVTGVVPDDQWLFDNYQEYWSPGDTIITSIGQGQFLATPLQMALNTAAVANDGVIYRPMLVKRTIDENGKSTDVKIETLREIKVNKNHFRVVREAMWGVVNDPVNGSAYQNTNLETFETSTKWPLSNPDGEPRIELAGKTGTAEIGEPDEFGIYSHQHAWFTAYAPAENPEIAVAVVLEDGGEGSSYAVPIADRAIRAYYELTEKRERGIMLRKDKQPITEEFPAPNLDALKLVPGALVASPDR